MVKILVSVAGAKPLYLSADEYVDKITYREYGKRRTLPVHMLFGTLPDGTVTAILVASPLVPSFDWAITDLKKAEEASPGIFISPRRKRTRHIY